MWGVGGQCFETSSFVRANSRGLVTGGRRLPDDGGISLERDGLRTHQPNQSWQNYGHACIAFFLSCGSNSSSFREEQFLEPMD